MAEIRGACCVCFVKLNLFARPVHQEPGPVEFRHHRRGEGPERSAASHRFAAVAALGDALGLFITDLFSVVVGAERRRPALLFLPLVDSDALSGYCSVAKRPDDLHAEFELPDVLRLWDSLFADTERFAFLNYCCCAMLVYAFVVPYFV